MEILLVRFGNFIPKAFLPDSQRPELIMDIALVVEMCSFLEIYVLQIWKYQESTP